MTTSPKTETSHARTVAAIVELGSLDGLTPEAVARVLGTHVASVEEVTPYRREYHLAPSETRLADVVVIEGGNSWRAITLVPPADVALQDLEARLLDVPYAQDVEMAHRDGGPFVRAIAHHFRVHHSELVVETAPPAQVGNPTVRDTLATSYDEGIDQSAEHGRRDPVLAITLTNEHRVPADAMTLRQFRAWAAKHPGK